MIIPKQSTGTRRITYTAHVYEMALCAQFFGRLIRKSKKAVRPVIRRSLRTISEGAHNQYGDLPTTAVRMVPVSLARGQRALFYPGIEGNPLGIAGGYAAGGDEYRCGTCANGNVMWCDEEGHSYGCWD